MRSITPLAKKSDSNPWPGPKQKLTVHYSLNGYAICEAESHLTAKTRFVEIPLPVLHRMMMGRMT